MIRNFIETICDRWANLHSFVRFLMLTVAVAGLGLLAANPGYRAFKAWRVERNLVAARKAVEEVRMDDARDLSLAVLQAGDPRLEAYQILEKATAALRDPRHGDIARALLSHPESTDEDRLNCFRSIAPEVALGLLGQAWSRLPAGCQQEPRFATVFADRLIAEGRLSEAAAVLLAVPEAARTSTVELRLIRVLIGSGKREGYDEAQRLIAAKMPAAAADIADIAEWLDLLETLPALGLQAKLLEPVRRVLENPPSGAGGRMALMLVRMDYAANFSRSAGILEDAIGRWRERDPESLADFLGDLGLYQRLLETFQANRLEQHPALFPRMLEAMERSGAWEQVVPLLEAHGQRLPKFEELAHRALVAAKTADAAARDAAWNAAIAEATASSLPTALLTLQRLAREAEMPDEAEQAMVAAIRLGRGPLPLYAELKPLLSSLAQQGRDNTLLEICTSYLAFEPDNPVLLTQFAYLACLNSVIELKTILKAMEALAAGFPKELNIQCVLATAYLCDGQQTKAAETFERLELDPAELPPGYRAAFLTTQVLTLRLAKDDPLITEFPWKSLQPSERKKFTELLRTTEPER
ncbi:MAG: hypothetical protein NTW21_10650 [Verrucomicrobia bacterium]|nr:hypothetical protein [Verrucomicrobiota bacterium]